MRKRSSLRIMRSVIYALVLREMLGRFGRNRLGVVWVLAEPLAHVLGMILVMSLLRNRALPGFDYPVFMLVGVTPFLLIKNTALRMMEGASANKGLFAYRQVTLMDTFIARTIVETLLSAAVFALILAGMLWLGFDIELARPLEWLGFLALGLAFGFSLGGLLAALAYALPEAKLAIRLAFLPLYFLSGVILPPWHFPPDTRAIMLWNPFVHLLELIRGAFFPFYPKMQGISASYVASITLVFAFASLALYRALRRRMTAL